MLEHADDPDPLRRADDATSMPSMPSSPPPTWATRRCIGRTPIPMLTDYAAAVREHDVWVLDADGASSASSSSMAPRGPPVARERRRGAGRQGRGLGRRLLDHAEDEARQRGFAEIGLLTNERYADDIAMYLRHGYRETHREPHLGTDLVHFRKDLAPPAGR